MGCAWRGLHVVLLIGFASGLAQNVCTRRRVGERLCPELFFLGARFAGSTAVAMYVASQPSMSVNFPHSLEPYVEFEAHFFDDNFLRGIDYFASLFPVRNVSYDLAADATPDYLMGRYVPLKIYDSLDFKAVYFLVTLRDPAARAYAWYKHSMGTRMNDISLNKAMSDFEYKYSLMAKYIAPIVAECVNGQDDPEEAYFACSGRVHYREHVKSPVIVETGNMATGIPRLQRGFTGGLYGPALLHWLRHFHASQFCLVIYENLLTQFEEEIDHLRPCLKPFGRDLHVQPGDGLSVPTITCTNCDEMENLEEETERSIGLALHRDLYASSNKVVRGLLWNLYRRDGIPVWEELYDG